MLNEVNNKSSFGCEKKLNKFNVLEKNKTACLA